MGSLSKLVKSAITDNEIKEDNLGPGVATTAKFGPGAVESSEIGDGTVTADDLASTLDLSSKSVTLPDGGVTADALASTLDLSSKSVTLPSSSLNFDREYFNISLLGFKMAVNENLTVFNLVDGIVDEFHDESGTDESEGSNDNYCATSDFYVNQTPDTNSAGFTTTSITEPDTSTTGTNPAYGAGTFGTFTVPSCMTSMTGYLWGSGGGNQGTGTGGGGGFSTGALAVTSGQAIKVVVGEGGHCGPGTPGNSLGAGGSGGISQGGGGGGLTGLFNDNELADWSGSTHGVSAPQVFLIAGSGGGGQQPSTGGAGGGTTGQSGSDLQEPSGHGTQNSASGCAGGGGSQTAGGEGGGGLADKDGGFLFGASGNIPLPEGTDDTGPQYSGGGGSGYYGGGAARRPSGEHSAGGGGSSYVGHPQITSGSTEAGNVAEGGGTANPNYVACTNENAEDGYVLLTGSSIVTASTTIVSTAFSANSVPTSSRIVVFEEDVDSPTLNTDIIASISRDGGSNYTNATLSDSGYVTGSSGQRILTGQATISGQPSGQSMRWKIALANNRVKIHGVSLSWA